MKHAFYCLPALALLALAGDDKRAAPPPPAPDLKGDAKALEAVLYESLKPVINRGVALYNGGDIAGCYRLFEGSLRTLKPLLARHADLVKEIDQALAAVEGNPVLWQRAFTLRAALDKVRKKFKPAPPAIIEKKDGKKDDPDKDDGRKKARLLKMPAELEDLNLPRELKDD